MKNSEESQVHDAEYEPATAGNQVFPQTWLGCHC